MRSDSGASTAFADALGAAIADRRITLSRLHRQLHDRGNPVAMATLSYWRSGSRQPEGAVSLAVVDDIELLLGLDSGRLSALLDSRPRIGSAPDARLPFEEDEISLAVEETIQTLGAAPQSWLRDLSSSVVGYVDADGDLERVVTRSLVQATGGVLRSLALFDILPSSPGIEPRIIADVIGGRAHPTHLHPGGRVLCDLIELDEPVPVGATALIEFTEIIPQGYPDKRSFSHITSRPARQTMLWARFHPEAIPDWCEEFTKSDEDEAVRWRSPRSTSLHAHRFGFGPAELGLRWGFDGD